MKQVVESYKEKKIAQYLAELPVGSKVLIVFWHGLGDLLMFRPIYHELTRHYCSQVSFDLCVQPGCGQTEAVPDALEISEDKFVENHDIAFVINFPMSEGNLTMTKAEKCMRDEIGLPDLPLIPILQPPPKNILVGVHMQGTCLPGSTNPDITLAKQIWDDILEMGYAPFDLHFQHIFHNPINTPFTFAGRHCRDLKPSIAMLRNIIGSCGAFVGVASGPFVMALNIFPDKTIYLQKHHNIRCYDKAFSNVVDLLKYRKEDLQFLLKRMVG